MIYLNPEIELIPLHDLDNLVGALTRSNLIQGEIVIHKDINRIELVNVVLNLLAEIEDISGDIRRADAESSRLANDVAELTEHVSQILGQLRDLLGHRRRLSDYSQVTLHHHYPRVDLSGGALGILNFDRNRIEELIRRGFYDASNHNCEANQCLRAGLRDKATPAAYARAPGSRLSKVS